ncbi:MAG: ATP-binding protein, partial [Desulfomicrobium sp.]|nr:ATP-binding protein [Desulfomicrobium sp.]
AMPTGGKLYIVASARDHELRIEIEDTGQGISPAHLPRVFEPFFSTKEVGRGTGLGLSICYDIVTDYEGTIHAFSKPGHGARFVVTLPIAESARNGTH